MFISLCLIVENFRIGNLRTGSPTKFADFNLRINDKKFADSNILEICGFAIVDEAQEFADLKKQLLGHLCKFTKRLGGNRLMKKTLSRKSCGTVPLNFLLHVQNCTK